MFRRDLLFAAALALLCALHLDFWAWQRHQPLLFGWVPYHLWYSGSLTVIGALFFMWWVKRMWPDSKEGGGE